MKLEPSFTDARLMLAGLYSTFNDNESALKEYNIVLTNNPAHEEAAVFKAQVLIEESRMTQATDFLKDFVNKNAQSAVAWYYLGRIEQQNEKYDKAIFAFRKAMSLHKSFSEAALSLGYLYEMRGMNDRAKEVYQQAFEEAQELKAADRLATILLKEEKYKEAMPYLEAISAADQTALNAKVKLGLVQMELKEYAKAATTFESIIEKTPDSDRVHYYLASVYEQMSRFDDAKDQLKEIKNSSRFYEDAVLHIAYLLKHEGKVAEAKEYLEKEIGKSPKVPNFYLFYASLIENESSVSRAVTILETAVHSFPEHEKIRYFLGSLYDRQGDTEKSLAQMEKILTINPDNADAMNYIAYTWTVQGKRLDDVELLLTKAKKIRPNNGYILDSWGWYLFVRGRTAEAVVALEKAVELVPTEPTILEHLGDVYLKTNLREKALIQYTKAASQADGMTKNKIVEKIENLRKDMLADKNETSTSRIPANK